MQKKDKEMEKALCELGKELTRYNNKDNFAKAFDKHFKKKRKSSNNIEKELRKKIKK